MVEQEEETSFLLEAESLQWKNIVLFVSRDAQKLSEEMGA